MARDVENGRKRKTKRPERERSPAPRSRLLQSARVTALCLQSFVLTAFTRGVPWPMPRSFPRGVCSINIPNWPIRLLDFLARTGSPPGVSNFHSTIQSRTGDHHCSSLPHCNLRTAVPQRCPLTSKLLYRTDCPHCNFPTFLLVFFAADVFEMLISPNGNGDSVSRGARFSRGECAKCPLAVGIC